MRADERLAAGGMEGEAVWLRIVEAIEELLSGERPDDTEVHQAPRKARTGASHLSESLADRQQTNRDRRLANFFSRLRCGEG